MKRNNENMEPYGDQRAKQYYNMAASSTHNEYDHQICTSNQRHYPGYDVSRSTPYPPYYGMQDYATAKPVHGYENNANASRVMYNSTAPVSSHSSPARIENHAYPHHSQARYNSTMHDRAAIAGRTPTSNTRCALIKAEAPTTLGASLGADCYSTAEEPVPYASHDIFTADLNSACTRIRKVENPYAIKRSTPHPPERSSVSVKHPLPAPGVYDTIYDNNKSNDVLDLSIKTVRQSADSTAPDLEVPLYLGKGREDHNTKCAKPPETNSSSSLDLFTKSVEQSIRNNRLHSNSSESRMGWSNEFDSESFAHAHSSLTKPTHKIPPNLPVYHNFAPVAGQSSNYHRDRVYKPPVTQAYSRHQQIQNSYPNSSSSLEFNSKTMFPQYSERPPNNYLYPDKYSVDISKSVPNHYTDPYKSAVSVEIKPANYIPKPIKREPKLPIKKTPVDPYTLSKFDSKYPKIEIASHPVNLIEDVEVHIEKTANSSLPINNLLPSLEQNLALKTNEEKSDVSKIKTASLDIITQSINLNPVKSEVSDKYVENYVSKLPAYSTTGNEIKQHCTEEIKLRTTLPTSEARAKIDKAPQTPLAEMKNSISPAVSDPGRPTVSRSHGQRPELIPISKMNLIKTNTDPVLNLSTTNTPSYMVSNSSQVEPTYYSRSSIMTVPKEQVYNKKIDYYGQRNTPSVSIEKHYVENDKLYLSQRMPYEDYKNISPVATPYTHVSKHSNDVRSQYYCNEAEKNSQKYPSGLLNTSRVLSPWKPVVPHSIPIDNRKGPPPPPPAAETPKRINTPSSQSPYAYQYHQLDPYYQVIPHSSRKVESYPYDGKTYPYPNYRPDPVYNKGSPYIDTNLHHYKNYVSHSQPVLSPHSPPHPPPPTTETSHQYYYPSAPVKTEYKAPHCYPPDTKIHTNPPYSTASHIQDKPHNISPFYPSPTTYSQSSHTRSDYSPYINQRSSTSQEYDYSRYSRTYDMSNPPAAHTPQLVAPQTPVSTPRHTPQESYVQNRQQPYSNSTTQPSPTFTASVTNTLQENSNIKGQIPYNKASVHSSPNYIHTPPPTPNSKPQMSHSVEKPLPPLKKLTTEVSKNNINKLNQQKIVKPMEEAVQPLYTSWGTFKASQPEQKQSISQEFTKYPYKNLVQNKTSKEENSNASSQSQDGWSKIRTSQEANKAENKTSEIKVENVKVEVNSEDEFDQAVSVLESDLRNNRSGITSKKSLVLGRRYAYKVQLKNANSENLAEDNLSFCESESENETQTQVADKFRGKYQNVNDKKTKERIVLTYASHSDNSATEVLQDEDESDFEEELKREIRAKSRKSRRKSGSDTDSSSDEEEPKNKSDISSAESSFSYSNDSEDSSEESYEDNVRKKRRLSSSSESEQRKTRSRSNIEMRRTRRRKKKSETKEDKMEVSEESSSPETRTRKKRKDILKNVKKEICDDSSSEDKSIKRKNVKKEIGDDSSSEDKSIKRKIVKKEIGDDSSSEDKTIKRKNVKKEIGDDSSSEDKSIKRPNEIVDDSSSSEEVKPKKRKLVLESDSEDSDPILRKLNNQRKIEETRSDVLEMKAWRVKAEKTSAKLLQALPDIPFRHTWKRPMFCGKFDRGWQEEHKKYKLESGRMPKKLVSVPVTPTDVKKTRSRNSQSSSEKSSLQKFLDKILNDDENAKSPLSPFTPFTPTGLTPTPSVAPSLLRDSDESSLRGDSPPASDSAALRRRSIATALIKKLQRHQYRKRLEAHWLKPYSLGQKGPITIKASGARREASIRSVFGDELPAYTSSTPTTPVDIDAAATIRKRKMKIRNRKFRSGFDYIPKKKKKFKVEDDSSVVSKKRMTIRRRTMWPENSRDISTEIRGWVINKGLGETVLHKAARLQYHDVVIHCLESSDTNVNVRDNAGYTPLHEACNKGHLDVAQALCAFGAHVNAPGYGGMRPLHEACDNGHVQLIRLLLSYGADVSLTSYAGQSCMTSGSSCGNFLANYINDLKEKRSELWQFEGPARCFDVQEQGADVFAEIPKTNSQDSDKSKEIFFFESSEKLQPPTFIVKGFQENFVLLNDLLDSLDMKYVDLVKSAGRIHTLQLCKSEFLKISCCLLDYTPNVVDDEVTLVRYNDKIKSLLGVESDHIS